VGHSGIGEAVSHVWIVQTWGYDRHGRARGYVRKRGPEGLYSDRFGRGV